MRTHRKGNDALAKALLTDTRGVPTAGAGTPRERRGQISARTYGIFVCTGLRITIKMTKDNRIQYPATPFPFVSYDRCNGHIHRYEERVTSGDLVCKSGVRVFYNLPFVMHIQSAAVRRIVIYSAGERRNTRRCTARLKRENARIPGRVLHSRSQTG